MAEPIFVASVIVGMLLWLFAVGILTSYGDTIPKKLRLYVIPVVLFVIYVVAVPLTVHWIVT